MLLVQPSSDHSQKLYALGQYIAQILKALFPYNNPHPQNKRSTKQREQFLYYENKTTTSESQTIPPNGFLVGISAEPSQHRATICLHTCSWGAFAPICQELKACNPRPLACQQHVLIDLPCAVPVALWLRVLVSDSPPRLHRCWGCFFPSKSFISLLALEEWPAFCISFPHKSSQALGTNGSPAEGRVDRERKCQRPNLGSECDRWGWVHSYNSLPQLMVYW